jgi:hypothetical protein
VPLYLGDDITDEDAFRTLAGRSVGIIVGHPDDPEMANRATAADFVRQSTVEVEQLLNTQAYAANKRYQRTTTMITSAGVGTPRTRTETDVLDKRDDTSAHPARVRHPSTQPASCRGTGSELVEQLIAERDVGGG